MVKYFAVAIFLSLICGSFALDEHFSPVLFFKHKESKKVFEKSVISATTQVNQNEFERKFDGFDKDQTIVFFVVPDLSPEDLSARNEQHIKAFQNIASGAEITEYIPFVENAVDNKVTNRKDVAHVSVSTTNELEPEPNSDNKIIIVQLPGYHVSESKFHWLARIDQAIHGVSQSKKLRDALFVLTSVVNSHLQGHSRQRRATDSGQHVLSDKGVLLYTANLMKRFIDRKQRDAPVEITTISANKSTNKITIKFQSKFPLSFDFDFDPITKYWSLNKETSTVADKKPIQLDVEIGAPQNFSFSCTNSVYFAVNDSEIQGIYLKRFQIQLSFDNDQIISKFTDNVYDCTGFTSVPIWSGLFVTFLLLGIVATGISYIMDIRTMDRFDDPKGKTITVTATE